MAAASRKLRDAEPAHTPLPAWRPLMSQLFSFNPVEQVERQHQLVSEMRNYFVPLVAGNETTSTA